MKSLKILHLDNFKADDETLIAFVGFQSELEELIISQPENSAFFIYLKTLSLPLKKLSIFARYISPEDYHQTLINLRLTLQEVHLSCSINFPIIKTLLNEMHHLKVLSFENSSGFPEGSNTRNLQPNYTIENFQIKGSQYSSTLFEKLTNVNILKFRSITHEFRHYFWKANVFMTQLKTLTLEGNLEEISRAIADFEMLRVTELFLDDEGAEKVLINDELFATSDCGSDDVVLMESDTLQKVLKSFPNLKKLEINFIDADHFNNNLLLTIGENCKLLEVLKINFEFSSTISNLATLLRSCKFFKFIELQKNSISLTFRKKVLKDIEYVKTMIENGLQLKIC